DILYKLLKQVKDKYLDLTLICSFGSLSEHKYKKLREIGIERYLLKFETSDRRLYKKIKPSDNLPDRLSHIKILKRLGFQVSSGNITGLPGQSIESLANDLLLLKNLDLPMVSTSIFIPNPMSNYADFTPGDINLTLNVMAILRIICPSALIPTTSSLETIKKDAQYLGLMAGANTVTLHDGTPKKYENEYIIYKRERYKPKNSLFKIVKKAGLEVSRASLLRNKLEDTLFYKLINKNLKYKKIAIYADNDKYTYDDLYAMVLKFCSFLRKNGIKEGQVVLLALFDSVEFIVAFLSCIKLGIIAAPVDPLLSSEEWNLTLSNSCPQHILAVESVYNKLQDKRVLKIAEEGSLKFFLLLLKAQIAEYISGGVDKNNPAILLYTSGTTGKPKGVIHTYKDLFVDNFPRAILKIKKKDIVYSCSRLFSSFGLGNSLLFPFHFGASVILSQNIPNPFSIQKILEQKPTLFFAVPTMYEALLSHSDTLKGRFDSVRLFIASGEKLYPDIYKQWDSVYKKRILECFGSSEMCHPFISNIPSKQGIDSPGKVVEGFQVRCDDNGRIFCKGPSLSAGYYNDGKLTKEKMIDGWFKSEDIGYIDKKGFVFFKGRDNLVFKLNGRWISILDIESKLRKYRLIREAAVAKERKGLKYFISLKNKTDEEGADRKVRKYCMENMRICEFPKKICFVNEIQKTRNGKINRKSLATITC
ncbi:MAG: AMP-binding protein, partial [Candidatus Omnitrophica bacterium]|nr:AMP-binding protein [Candidatus Omnitrophota bacterium]